MVMISHWQGKTLVRQTATRSQITQMYGLNLEYSNKHITREHSKDFTLSNVYEKTCTILSREKSKDLLKVFQLCKVVPLRQE